MFWIEEIENQSFVLFSHCSLKDYQDELSEIGGMYMDNINCASTAGTREGWVFSNEHRGSVDNFIEEQTSDIKSSSEDNLTLDDLYDLLVEAFDRISELERRIELISQ